ncbi:DUF1534 domain-containing protein [Pseudomonas congelans]|nr:DUF1534 domain-containing protein [Pseudomonas congelans]
MRHKLAPRRMFKIGRGASRTAFPRWSVGTITCAREWKQESSLTSAAGFSRRGSGRR